MQLILQILAVLLVGIVALKVGYAIAARRAEMRHNPSKETFLRALGVMSDKLVELGYATQVVRDDAAEGITIFWTPLGRTLQQEVGRMFPEIRDGKATANLLDCQTMLALFLKTNSGTEGRNGRGRRKV